MQLPQARAIDRHRLPAWARIEAGRRLPPHFVARLFLPVTLMSVLFAGAMVAGVSVLEHFDPRPAGPALPYAMSVAFLAAAAMMWVIHRQPAVNYLRLLRHGIVGSAQAMTEYEDRAPRRLLIKFGTGARLTFPLQVDHEPLVIMLPGRPETARLVETLDGAPVITPDAVELVKPPCAWWLTYVLLAAGVVTDLALLWRGV